MKNPPVNILMATYNGASFIKEQIQSLMAQTFPEFKILIRDDGSTDKSHEVLQKLQADFSESIRIVELSEKNQGIAFSYSQLLEESDADYLMLCDQDDIWLPHKVEISIKRIKNLEKKFGSETPILVHSDLKVVNENLKSINNSFYRYQGLNPKKVELNRLLVRNVVTGCTMAINSSLKKIASNIPADARMHDWWLALVASIFGVIDFIEKPQVLYRQHSGNSVGAGPATAKALMEKAQTNLQLKNDFMKNFNQVRILLNRYENKMSRKDKETCYSFLSMAGAPPLSAVYTMFRHCFFSHGLWRNAGLILLLTGAYGRLSE
jgi:glycosyltransferase involved in cell wall biosynthesis